MTISDFTIEYIEEAQKLYFQNYEEERNFVPALPAATPFPDISEFANNGMGVAAFEQGQMIGFLCAYSPFDNAFGNHVKGVWSPIHANAAVGNKGEIYGCMFQAAAKKWVEAGALSHSITRFAHDTKSTDLFFSYGFGLRCVDAIRRVQSIECVTCEGYEFAECPRNRAQDTRHLYNRMLKHLAASPCFLVHSPVEEQDRIETVNRQNSRVFTVSCAERKIGFIEIMAQGENYICDLPDMMNICGAYLLPEYRGQGIYQNLLNFVIDTLQIEGYSRLGVDFESYNPTATGFWLKYFTPYTHSVVRRIDEKALL
jgi:GNAT superfamily N-acetyltransferase